MCVLDSVVLFDYFGVSEKNCHKIENDAKFHRVFSIGLYFYFPKTKK